MTERERRYIRRVALEMAMEFGKTAQEVMACADMFVEYIGQEQVKITYDTPLKIKLGK